MKPAYDYIGVPYPATQPVPATLQDFIHAIHAFEMMRVRETQQQAGIVGGAHHD